MPRRAHDDARIAGAVRIRVGTRADFSTLECIERETAPMFPPSLLPAEAACPLPEATLAAGVADSLLWVADVDDIGPVGFILCERHGTCLHLAEMDVRPSHARRGIGTRLLLHACAAAADEGLRFVTLTTFGPLPWNAPFYARHGFEAIRNAGDYAHLDAALRSERERGLRERVAMVKDLGGFARVIEARLCPKGCRV